MSFYNKKEDVIDIQLTSYGKTRLSQGKLKPAFYAFFDDDIIYDIGAAGEVEAQNDSQPRITGSLRLRNQGSYIGAETMVKQVIEEIRTSNSKLKETDFIPFQGSKEKSYALGDPMGTASPTTQNLPSWRIRALKNKFDSFCPYLTGTDGDDAGETVPPSIRIPQITANIDCYLQTVQNIRKWDYRESESVEILHTYSDESALVFVKDDALLDISEINGVFSKDNFDVEIYELQGSVDFGNMDTATTCHYSGSSLSFVDEGLSPDNIPEVDSTYVEYFFDMFIDDEIDQDTMCSLAPADPAQGIFDARSVECAPNKDAKNEDVYGIPLNAQDAIGPCED